MSSTYDTETVALKQCCRCSSGLLDRDQYCRRCGAQQYSAYITSALDRRADDRHFFRPVSGPLLKEVLANMSAGAAAQSDNKTVKTMAFMMICVPIWLMILLLSPLDAWRTAKNLAQQM